MSDDLFSQPSRPNADVWTVSRLNQEVKQLLDCSFGLLWLQGEISNFSKPASGHYYFSLKDSIAQIRCAMFKSRNRYLDFLPETGMQVLARGRLSLYEPRGEYQFIVEHIEETGTGALQRQFEQRYEKLKSEGLFDDEHKRPLAVYPKTLGIITSATGAALQDALDVLARRYPIAEVLVYPSPVQGDSAAATIAAQLIRASNEQRCDTLLLVRGGGSMEDLWSFNEEVVVRAVADSSIPVVCGVGHEIDFTLADFAADLRAPTPSAAAELACPESAEVAGEFRYWHTEIQRSLEHQLEQKSARLNTLIQRLKIQHPERQLQQKFQRCDELSSRLTRAIKQKLAAQRNDLDKLSVKLFSQSPLQRTARQRDVVGQAVHRLQNAMEFSLSSLSARLRENMHALHVASPMATLERGYSITLREDNNAPLTSIAALGKGDEIHTRLTDGVIVSEVNETREL